MTTGRDNPECAPYCPGYTPDRDYFFAVNTLMFSLIVVLVILLVVLILDYKSE